MASEASICNAALQLIKNNKRISDLEEGTKEANACEEIYEDLRDFVLENHTWNFAQKRKQLARLGSEYTPAFGWDYGYEIPSDFLRLTALYDNRDERGAVPYSKESGQINSNASELFLLYTARITDPNLMPPSFRNALSKLIASRLAVALANDKQRSQVLYEQFIDQDLPAAESADSMQNYPTSRPESSWNTVRWGHYPTYTPGDPPSS